MVKGTKVFKSTKDARLSANAWCALPLNIGQGWEFSGKYDGLEFEVRKANQENDLLDEDARPVSRIKTKPNSS